VGVSVTKAKADEAIAILKGWAGTRPADEKDDVDLDPPLSNSQKLRLWKLFSSPEAPATISSQLPR
jgi:hypothetical protein